MELKEEKKGSHGQQEARRERGRGKNEGKEKERETHVKNGHPAREDSLGLRRAMRPCSGRDSFFVCKLQNASRTSIRPNRREIPLPIVNQTFSSDGNLESPGSI